MTDKSLDDIAAAINDSSLPPVHSWNPSYEGSIDIVIGRDGRWWHEGGLIGRPALVKLFAGIMRRDFQNDPLDSGQQDQWLPGGGEYALVTPVERLRIVVEDAPFVAVSLQVHGEARETNDQARQTLVLRTNTEDQIIVDQKHPLAVVYENSDAEPRPYVLVRDSLPALISRNVWNQLADLVVENNGAYGVYSAGTFFALWNEPEIE